MPGHATGMGRILVDDAISARQAGTAGVGLLGGGFCRDTTVVSSTTPYATCGQSVDNLALPVEE